METHESASQTAMEQKRETHGEEDRKVVAERGEGDDVTAKMAELEVRDIKQPRLARPRRPEHMLPNAAFTFKPSIPTADLGVDKTAQMLETKVDDMKQLTKTVSERPKHTLPAFKFKLPALDQGLMPETHTYKGKGVSVAAKTTGLPAYVEIHPPRPVSQHPEHLVPSAAFTFTSTIRNPKLRPTLALKERNGIDVTSSMAQLQVGNSRQPPGKVSEPQRPAHFLPNGAFISASPSRVIGPTSNVGFGVTRPVDIQDTAPKIVSNLPKHGLPTAAFTFVPPIRTGGSASTPDAESDAAVAAEAQKNDTLLRMIDGEKVEALFRSGQTDKLDPATRCLLIAYAEARQSAAKAEMLKHQKALAEGRQKSYELADLPRDHPDLDIFSEEFWVAFDLCCEANTACKKLEAELVELLEHQRLNTSIEGFCLHITQKSKEQSAGGASLSTRIEAEDGSKALESRIAERKERESRQLISQKRSELLKLEEEVSRISDDLFVQNGLLPPE